MCRYPACFVALRCYVFLIDTTPIVIGCCSRPMRAVWHWTGLILLLTMSLLCRTWFVWWPTTNRTFIFQWRPSPWLTMTHASRSRSAWKTARAWCTRCGRWKTSGRTRLACTPSRTIIGDEVYNTKPTSSSSFPSQTFPTEPLHAELDWTLAPFFLHNHGHLVIDPLPYMDMSWVQLIAVNSEAIKRAVVMGENQRSIGCFFLENKSRKTCFHCDSWHFENLLRKYWLTAIVVNGEYLTKRVVSFNSAWNLKANFRFRVICMWSVTTLSLWAVC